MTTSTAYFLVIHGSRNRKTHAAANKLQQLIAFKLKSKIIIAQAKYLNAARPAKGLTKNDNFSRSDIPLVDIAALELASLSLNESLVEFALKAESRGYDRIEVLPLFLAPGVHVREDIPLEIKLAIKQIKDRVRIKLSPFLGKYSETSTLLNDKFQQLSSQKSVNHNTTTSAVALAQKRVLVAHGSNLLGVEEYYQNLATRLNALIAYWSLKPSVSDRIQALVAEGETSIGIVPYFLFPGKITEAISTEVASLQAKYPTVDLRLAEPLGETDALAELIVQKIVSHKN